MKNLLIVMLALGMASVGNATYTLVVDGEEVGDEYTLDSGAVIDIGIYNDTPGDSSNTMQLYAFMIIYDVTGGEWTGVNNVYIPPAVPGSVNTDYGVGDHLGTGNLVDVFEGDLSNPGIHYTGVGVLADYQYRCLAIGHNVLVELMNGTTLDILDSLIIHQIPEPMTITLLGLGGLFLLHRRK